METHKEMLDRHRWTDYEATLVVMIEEVKQHNDSKGMEVLLESALHIVQRRLDRMCRIERIRNEAYVDRVIDAIKGIGKEQ